MFMKQFIILLVMLIPLTGLAQKRGSDSAIVVAKREFGIMRYAYAIPFYKRHLATHADDVDALKEIGYCYKINNQYDSAIYYYQQAFNLGGVKDNVLAELYASMGLYEKAVKAYDSLITGDDLDTSSLTYKWYKARQKGFYNHEVYYQDTVDYKLYYLKVNTPLNEFSPALLDNGFVFESNRGRNISKSKEFGWDGKSFTQLYFQASKDNLRVDEIQNSIWLDKKIRKSTSDYTLNSVNDNEIFSQLYDLKKYNYKELMEVPLLDNSFGSKGNYGSISFTKDGKEAYFTKNQKIGTGLNELEIWSAKRSGGNNWSKFKRLPIKEKGSSIFHPAISDDGNRLYFASDQEGGFGGTDIYYAEKEGDGKWGSPINAGEPINTAGNELFPTFYEGVLYFSSNGHGGLGGLDVFRYISNETTSEVENVGAPVNSEKDDLGYSRKGEGGYFSSNRYGSDDIFEYEFNAKQVKILGKTLVDKVAKEGVAMKLYSIDKEKVVDSTLTDAQGRYNLKGRPYSRYQLMMDDGNGHGMSKDLITDKGDKDMGTIDILPEPVIPEPDINIPEEENKGVVSRRERELLRDADKEVPVGKARKFVVYYDLNKSFLTANDKTVLNELVTQMKQNKTLNAVIGSFTDCSADMDYNIRLSNKRSAAVTRYLKDMGVAAGRIVESHYGKNYLVKQCEEGNYDVAEQLVNRRSEIYLSEQKSKKWDAINKEDEKYPVRYSKDLDNPESVSTPRNGGKSSEYNQPVSRRNNVISSEGEDNVSESVTRKEGLPPIPGGQSINNGDTIVFVVYFNLDQYDLSSSFGTLAGLKDLLKSFNDYKCLLTGHTDNEGSAAYDQKLSERRANTVKNYFLSYNVSDSRIKVIGYGSTKPAIEADRDLYEGWKNRRVEIRLFR